MKTSKTHYDPYSDEYEYAPEMTLCGVRPAEDYECTTRWSHVDCKRCLKSRKRIEKELDAILEDRCREMGDMVKFFERPENA